MMTKEMEDLKFVCDNCYNGDLEYMAKCYKRVIEKRKEAGDIKDIRILEKELETIEDMRITTETDDRPKSGFQLNDFIKKISLSINTCKNSVVSSDFEIVVYISQKLFSELKNVSYKLGENTDLEKNKIFGFKYLIHSELEKFDFKLVPQRKKL